MKINVCGKKLETHEVYQRQTGSHHLYSNGEKTVAIPNSLNPCIALRLAKETGATNLINRRNK